MTILPNTLKVIDMHAAGEPVRIIPPGQIPLQGATILEKRRDMRRRFDTLRTALMQEPRGHADMYGAILTEPCDPGADIGVLFMHHSGYSTMCGHATIALGRYLYDEHLKRHPHAPRTIFRIECPCGPVEVRLSEDGGGGLACEFDSVACFVEGADEVAEIDGLGRVTYDIAYGGAYYAILPAAALGLDFHATEVARLADAARTITEHLRRCRPIAHPEEKDLSFLYGTILTDDIGPEDNAISHNLCLFGAGQIDRSPTGSGVSARMALYHHKGLLRHGQKLSFAGFSGIPFHARLCRDTPRGVSVTVSGSGHYLSRSEILFDSRDPLGQGFALPRRFADLMHPERPGA